jgi:hypothetical protein
VYPPPYSPLPPTGVRVLPGAELRLGVLYHKKLTRVSCGSREPVYPGYYSGCVGVGYVWMTRRWNRYDRPYGPTPTPTLPPLPRPYRSSPVVLDTLVLVYKGYQQGALREVTRTPVGGRGDTGVLRGLSLYTLVPVPRVVTWNPTVTIPSPWIYPPYHRVPTRLPLTTLT